MGLEGHALSCPKILGTRQRAFLQQSHALGAIDRIDQLPETSEGAAMWSKNEPRQPENLGLVSFLG